MTVTDFATAINVLAKISELQGRRITLMNLLRMERASVAFWDASIEMGTHKSHHHQQYWNGDYIVQQKTRAEDDARQTEQKLSANKRQIEHFREVLKELGVEALPDHDFEPAIV